MNQAVNLIMFSLVDHYISCNIILNLVHNNITTDFNSVVNNFVYSTGLNYARKISLPHSYCG